jgi:hypothetical protein
MRRVIAAVGYALVSFLIAGLCLQVLVALLHNRPFYGVNYLWLGLGTYSTAAALGLAGVVGIVRLFQVVSSRRRTPSPPPPPLRGPPPPSA